MLLGGAIYLCMASGVLPLIVVSAIIGTAAACVVTSRNAATPRHALLLLILIAVPFAAGLARSPIEGMTVAAMLIIPWVASLYLFVEQNHASMLRMIKAERRAHALAITDELTGLFNRMHFTERRAKLDARDARKAGYCFLSLDLDGFKQINDQYGHVFGDTVLKNIALAIRSCVKGRDLVARYGGEEFVVLLPSTALAGATVLAEQIRATIAGARIRRGSSHENVGAITVSLGVAAWHPGEALESLIDRADKALYCSKREGRNRVTAGA